MDNSHQLFYKFVIGGSKILEALNKSALGETTEKSLRKWNLSDMADLVGRTPHTIVKNIKSGNLQKPQTSSNIQKIYSIHDINKARELFETKPSKPQGSNAQIIAFTNFKGGVAKTTSAVHASHYFAKAGYKVLLIDTDSQASATSSFGFSPDHDFSPDETLLPIFTESNIEIKNLIKKTYWGTLDLIPANLSLYKAELEIPIIGENYRKKGISYSIHNILLENINTIRNQYDIILIDCPPSMSILNTNALFAADGLIIPCPPELPDVASMFQFFEMIQDALKRYPEKQYSFARVLMTKVDGSNTSSLVIKALRAVFGNHILHSEMLNTQVIKRARTEMQSVYEIDSYKGSKKTLERAIQIVDSVNKEIEALIKDSWLSSAQIDTNLIKEVI